MAASVSSSPVAFPGASSASDLLRSSRSGFSGTQLRTLVIGTQRLSSRMTPRDFTVVAKIRRRRKQYEYPWPKNPDPNVKGGVLRHLSHFKPLADKDKPKPVTLDFEKPLVELEKKIKDVREMARDTGLDFTDQIEMLEKKYQESREYLYTHLEPIQRVYLARHPHRPTFLDHIFNITEKFVELHGDRAGYDDPAIVTGLGSIDGRTYMFIGHQKGRNTKENVKRNFGMPTPHGYRKALRLMHYADHHEFPIVTFIDTPGAFADLKSEFLGQGEAIAQNLRSMFGLKVPVISIVIGEGGSGGALAIGCANKLLMLENSVFYVASPEAAAAILYKDAKAAPKAAKRLKITASALCRLKVADGIIPEPLGGAHVDPMWTSMQIKDAIKKAMDELTKMDIDQLLEHRRLKFRKLGRYKEGVPIDPYKKRNMKKRELPLSAGPSVQELEGQVERLKKYVNSYVRVSPKDESLNHMIQKIEAEANLEYFEAAKALGFGKKISELRQQAKSAMGNKGQHNYSELADKLKEIRMELDQALPAAPNYDILKRKVELLDEITKIKSLLEKQAKLRQGIEDEEESMSDLLEKAKPNLEKSPKLKEMLNVLKLRISKSEKKLDASAKEKVVSQMRNILSQVADAKTTEELVLKHEELEAEISSALIYLKELGQRLENDGTKETSKYNEPTPEGSSSELNNNHVELQTEISSSIESPVGLDGSLNNDDPNETKETSKYNESTLEDSSSELNNNHAELQTEISSAIESPVGLDGSLNDDDANERSDYEESMGINLGANRNVS